MALLTMQRTFGPTMDSIVRIYRLGACLKCRGDLYADNRDWICLQCGTYYYTGLYRTDGKGSHQTLRFGTISPTHPRLDLAIKAGRGK